MTSVFVVALLIMKDKMGAILSHLVELINTSYTWSRLVLQ